MNDFDMQRIENAVWTLFQYQDEIENMASDMRLDRCEIEAMFKTLSYVRGLPEKFQHQDDTAEPCIHDWEHFTQIDDAFRMTRTVVYRCKKCGEKLTKEGVLL